MEFLLVHDLARFIPREDAKLIEPIPAGAEYFQQAGAQPIPYRKDARFPSVLRHFEIQTQAPIDFEQPAPVDLASAIRGWVNETKQVLSASTDAFRVHHRFRLASIVFAGEIDKVIVSVPCAERAGVHFPADVESVSAPPMLRNLKIGNHKIRFRNRVYRARTKLGDSLRPRVA